MHLASVSEMALLKESTSSGTTLPIDFAPNAPAHHLPAVCAVCREVVRVY